VVEDEPAILELLKVNLIDAGYEVQSAGDAGRTSCPRSLPSLLPD
jgi:DNA-binding response OmpR family regulator